MKYLFTAHYSDATSYSQTAEDKAVTKPTGSAYSDIDHSKIIGFSLSNHDKSQNYYIDLKTGEITLSGLVNAKINSYFGQRQYRLIYYRHNVVNTISTIVETTFCIGWQFTDENGHNIKKILEIF